MDLIRSHGLPAMAAQAAMQLLKYLLRRHEFGMRFVNRDGIGALLSLPSTAHFAGQTGLSCSLLRRVLEEPRVLLKNMVEDIVFKMLALRDKVSRRLRLDTFIAHFMSLVGRNSSVFAAALLATMKKSAPRRLDEPYRGGVMPYVELHPWYCDARVGIRNGSVDVMSSPLVQAVLGKVEARTSGGRGAAAPATTTASTDGSMPQLSRSRSVGGSRDKRAAAGAQATASFGVGAAPDTIAALRAAVRRRKLPKGTGRVAFRGFSESVVQYLAECLLTSMMDEYTSETERADAAAQAAASTKPSSTQPKQGGLPTKKPGRRRLGSGASAHSDTHGGPAGEAERKTSSSGEGASSEAAGSKKSSGEKRPGTTGSMFALSCSRLLQMLSELVRVHPYCIDVRG